MTAPQARQHSPVTTQQRWIRVFILTLGTFIILCFALADPVLRGARKNDFKNAPTQTGVAEVVTLVIPSPNIEGDVKGEQTPLVGVRFRGGIYNARKAYDVKHIVEGQRARIEYRVGKSGAIAVDSAEPLPAPSPVPGSP